MKRASPELEARLDRSHIEARKLGFNGFSRFEQMRQQHGTLEAARRLVVSGTIQSGFTWCVDRARPDISVEQAVIDFASEFDEGTVQCARWRLKMASAGVRC